MKRFLTGILVLLFTVSCGDDNPPSSKSLAGTYALRNLAFVLGGISVTMEPPQATGSLVLTESRYTLNLTFTIEADVETTTERGSYSVSGTVIIWTPDGDEPPYTNQISADGREITFTQTETVENETVSATITFVRI